MYKQHHINLWNHYWSLMSSEFRATIDHFKPYYFRLEEGQLINGIKVVFKNGTWIRVYMNNRNIEWF